MTLSHSIMQPQNTYDILRFKTCVRFKSQVSSLEFELTIEVNDLQLCQVFAEPEIVNKCKFKLTTFYEMGI